jgi:hypothetical protein
MQVHVGVGAPSRLRRLRENAPAGRPRVSPRRAQRTDAGPDAAARRWTQPFANMARRHARDATQGVPCFTLQKYDFP